MPIKKIAEHIFERTLEKLMLWKFWKIIKKIVFNSVSFKKFELSNRTTYNDAENSFHRKCFFCLFWETSKLLGERLVESHFSKVRETSTACNSVEKKLTRAWYVPKSDFSRNFEKSPFNRSCRFTVFSL